MIKKISSISLAVLLIGIISSPLSVVAEVSTDNSSTEFSTTSLPDESTTGQSTVESTSESTTEKTNTTSSDINSTTSESSLSKESATKNTENTNPRKSLETAKPINQLFPDKNLAQRVADTFGKKPEDSIETSTIESFTGIFSTDKVDDTHPDLEINNIEGIQYFINASEISLSRIKGTNQKNKIQDLTPFSKASFKRLRVLILDNNNIDDVSPLSQLFTLLELGLNNNTITNISGISKLTNIQKLSLQNNHIDSIPDEAELNNLEELYVANNDIKEISGLKQSLKLKKIFIENNPSLTDISPLSSLNLEQVSLINDPVGTLNGLSNSSNLKVLFASNTGVSDLTPLTSKKMEILLVENNHIRDLAPLSSSNLSMRWFAGRGQTVNNQTIIAYELNKAFSIKSGIILPDNTDYTRVFNMKNISDGGKLVHKSIVPGKDWVVEWNLSQPPKHDSRVDYSWEMPKQYKDTWTDIFPNLNNPSSQNFTGEVVQPLKRIGILAFDVPSIINYGGSVKLSPNMLHLKGESMGDLMVSDTRDSNQKTNWQLLLKEKAPLINKNDVKISYKNRDNQLININKNNQPIEHNLANHPEEEKISDDWKKPERGLFLDIPPEAQKIGGYSGSLTWTLQDTPQAN